MKPVITAALLLAAAASAQDCSVDDVAKVDCGSLDQGACEAAGCCWQEHSDDSAGTVPWCFVASASAGGYDLISHVSTPTGLTGTLKSQNPASDALGDDIATLSLEITFASGIVRVLITDANDTGRWQIPESIVPSAVAGESGDVSKYSFTFTESPFTFTVTRNSDSAVVFSSSPTLVFKDQYIEIGTSLNPTASLFGVGEVTRTAGMKIAPGTTTALWARDMPAAAFDTNLYGSHPMYLALEETGKASGAFLRNSNGMDITYAASADSLTFKTIGGVIDLFVFVGPAPVDVAAQYTALIGRPAMMPYWSLGYHQCRYGYKTLDEVKAVRSNFSAAAIPLDNVWMDIDYMERWEDWTYDVANFPEADVREFIDDVHASGQKFVIIVDPGILKLDDSWNTTYPPYTDGMEQGLFVRDGFTGEPYVTQVWPGPTVMPDWFHPSTAAYWTDSIKTFWESVPFDGLWTDMNEVSNFCNDGGVGQVCENTDPANCPTGVLETQTTCCLTCSLKDASDPYDFPPYAINNDASKQALGHKTLPMSALHYRDGEEGSDKFTLKEYDVHNLFGLMESRLTAEALTTVRASRPFVLSRSTFASSGAHVAHWTGDNAATWADLKASSVTVMNMNLYGVAMTGSDMCGFIDETTEELCGRWMALGAFHPFSRNHNTIGVPGQEPYLWDSVAAVSRAALGLRYRLLPYLYSLFYEAHTSGSMVAQPLWAQFAADPATHAIDEQFLLGPALLVSPALHEGQLTVGAYFPNGGADGTTVWYPLKGGESSVPVVCTGGEGKIVTLDTPLSAFNVHIRSGSIIPLHAGSDATGAAPLTTVAARALPYELLVALDSTASVASASGGLFHDDGEQVELADFANVAYAASSSASGGSLTASVLEDGFGADSTLGTVVVLGLGAAPAKATVAVGDAGESIDVAVAADINGSGVEFDLTSAGIAMNQAFNLSWSA